MTKRNLFADISEGFEALTENRAGKRNLPAHEVQQRPAPALQASERIASGKSLHLVFVFGTLKDGFPNFATNKGARIGGAFMTTERYPLYLVGERFSPWLVDAPGEGERVVGQVFEVDEPALAAMDALERITEPDGYRRVELEVQALEGERGTSRPAAPKANPEALLLRAHAYLKPRAQLASADVRSGPLKEYTPELAALYRSRGAPGVGASSKRE